MGKKIQVLKEAPIRILENASLKTYNTFGIDVGCSYLAEIHSLREFKLIRNDQRYKDSETIFLGGGSNILFCRDFKGMVLVNRIGGISVSNEDETRVWLKSGSGEIWHELVQFAVGNGWGGIENLSLIPGSVGAGPMQNIGAYGVELRDCFYELEALDLQSGTIRVFSNADCEFGYRESIFKRELRNRFLILSVTLQLTKFPVVNTSYGAIRSELDRMGVLEPTIKDVSQAVIAIRTSKLPDWRLLGNAGSFFKNPEVEADFHDELQNNFPELVSYAQANGRFKLAAGWLIEQCGWKGKRLGEVGVHEKQALVLVNYGSAKGIDVYNLSEEILQSVKSKFNVTLEREVNIVR